MRRPRAARALGLLLLAASPAASQTYDITWRTIGASGAMGNAGGAYVLDSTAGQTQAGGPIAAEPYVLASGFWALIAGGTGGSPHADLSITKTDGQATAVPGQPVTYTIAVANAGPSDVTGATVLDSLPAALQGAVWTCTASPGSSCTASGSGGINDPVTLLAGGSVAYTLTAGIDPAATGVLGNSATVEAPAGVPDPDPSNNASTDSDALTPQADLSITLADSPDPVAAGRLLGYTVQVTNLGPSASSGMTLLDALSPETIFVSSDPGAPACGESGGTVTCTLGALLPLASHSVTIQTVVVPTALGSIGNSVEVTGSEPDPVSTNDTATESTEVVPQGEGELVHGTSFQADLASVGGSPDQDLFRIHQGAHASYEVVVDATSGDIGAGAGPLLDRVASDTTTVLQSSAPAGVGHSRSLRWANTSDAAVDDEYVRVRSGSCASDCDPSDVYRIHAYDTTYSISRFNNSGTQSSVLVIQNISPAPVAGEVFFWASATGALLHAQAFSVPGHGSFVLNTAGVPPLVGQGGSVTLAHDGGYGCLAGKAVALEPSTGFSFDTPLLARRLR